MQSIITSPSPDALALKKIMLPQPLSKKQHDTK